jgi:hypothetical protein
MISPESITAGTVALDSWLASAGLLQAETNNIATVINTVNEMVLEFIILFLCIALLTFSPECQNKSSYTDKSDRANDMRQNGPTAENEYDDP